MEVKAGTLVISLKGHDKGLLFQVLGSSDDGYVLIADGKRRKIEKPKRKKLKHLKTVGMMTPARPGADTNRGLRRALKDYTAASAADEEGIKLV